MMDAKNQPYLNLNSWAGRTSHKVEIIKETPQCYRVKLLEDCLKGDTGAIILVPKYAICWRFDND